nr:hypothetical protein [uncultured bacterium]
MPECKNLQPWRIREHLIVEEVLGLTEEDPLYAREGDVRGSGSGKRVAGDEVECAGDFVRKHVGGRCTVLGPPSRCCAQMSRSLARDQDRQAVGQGRRRISLSNSQPSTTSPRRACSIDSSSSASCSGVAVKVSSPLIRTATFAPSSRGEPSITTLPSTTFPSATSMTLL